MTIPTGDVQSRYILDTSLAEANSRRLTQRLKSDAAEQAQAFAVARERANAFANGLLTVGVAAGGLAAAGTIVSGQWEQTGKAFDVMLGSAQAAKREMADLKQFSLDSGQQFLQTTQKAQALLNSGIKPENLLTTMRAIAGASAASGRGAEGYSRIAMAISQIQAKGKVMGEEMNQQLGELMPAWDLLASKMGKSKAELMEMAKAGKLSADDAIPALIAAMNERYGALVDAQADTLFGKWNAIITKLQSKAAEGGDDGLLGVGKQLLDMLSDLIDVFDAMDPKLLVWAAGLGIGASAVIKVVLATAKLKADLVSLGVLKQADAKRSEASAAAAVSAAAQEVQALESVMAAYTKKARAQAGSIIHSQAGPVMVGVSGSDAQLAGAGHSVRDLADVRGQLAEVQMLKTYAAELAVVTKAEHAAAAAALQRKSTMASNANMVAATGRMQEAQATLEQLAAEERLLIALEQEIATEARLRAATLSRTTAAEASIVAEQSRQTKAGRDAINMLQALLGATNNTASGMSKMKGATSGVTAALVGMKGEMAGLLMMGADLALFVALFREISAVVELATGKYDEYLQRTNDSAGKALWKVLTNQVSEDELKPQLLAFEKIDKDIQRAQRQLDNLQQLADGLRETMIDLEKGSKDYAYQDRLLQEAEGRISELQRLYPQLTTATQQHTEAVQENARALVDAREAMAEVQAIADDRATTNAALLSLEIQAATADGMRADMLRAQIGYERELLALRGQRLQAQNAYYAAVRAEKDAAEKDGRDIDTSAIAVQYETRLLDLTNQEADAMRRRAQAEQIAQALSRKRVQDAERDRAERIRLGDERAMLAEVDAWGQANTRARELDAQGYYRRAETVRRVADLQAQLGAAGIEVEEATRLRAEMARMQITQRAQDRLTSEQYATEYALARATSEQEKRKITLASNLRKLAIDDWASAQQLTIEAGLRAELQAIKASEDARKAAEERAADFAKQLREATYAAEDVTRAKRFRDRDAELTQAYAGRRLLAEMYGGNAEQVGMAESLDRAVLEYDQAVAGAWTAFRRGLANGENYTVLYATLYGALDEAVTRLQTKKYTLNIDFAKSTWEELRGNILQAWNLGVWKGSRWGEALQAGMEYRAQRLPAMTLPNLTLPQVASPATAAAGQQTMTVKILDLTNLGVMVEPLVDGRLVELVR